MNPEARPRFGKGVKLRHEGEDRAMLLVPEGALTLNPPAVAALSLVDGKRSFGEIVAGVVERFDVSAETATRELDELFERLRERGFIDAV